MWLGQHRRMIFHGMLDFSRRASAPVLARRPSFLSDRNGISGLNATNADNRRIHAKAGVETAPEHVEPVVLRQCREQFAVIR